MKKLIFILIFSCIIVHASAALVNVSAGKTATASSLYGGSSASLATDGITAAPWPIFHTAPGDLNPWLLIDLGKTELIKEFTFWNRNDACCWARMRDLQVEILDEFEQVVYTSEVVNPGNVLGITDYTIPSITLSIDNTVPGQLVRIHRIPYTQDPANGDGHLLQLNEVQVFADGLSASIASKPSPYNDEVDVPLSVTLSWDASLLDDPNTPAPPYPNPNLIRHELYLSSGNLGDPNLVHIASIPAGAARVEYGPIVIHRDGVYYWRVDEVMPDPVNPALQKTITGFVWNFNTVPSKPIIDSATPAKQMVSPGETAVFSVSATNPFTGDVSNLSYAWFKSADNANDTLADDISVGTNSPSLTLSNVQLLDKGYYYCNVTNSDVGGGTSSSNMAILIIKQYSLYKFDEATDTAGSYTDATGGHDATMVYPEYTRSYITGADGIANSAIMMNHSSMANAGTWDPSEFTNEMTVCCWINWGGVRGAATYQGIVGKASAWDTTNKWMWRTGNNNSTLQFFRNNSYGPNITLTVDTKWHLLCMTVANGTSTAYIDGVKTLSQAFTFGSANTDPIWIGLAENNAERYFNGGMDDLRIYNYALSPEEIIEVYNEIAVIDIAPCLYPIGEADYNGDCKVTLLDFAQLASGWLSCGLYPDGNCN